MIRRTGIASPQRRWVGLLLGAMLLMQLLGLLHGIVHAAGPLQAMHDGAATPADRVGLERLFSHHGAAADCQVFDQLSQGGAPGFAQPELDLGHPAVPCQHARPLPRVAMPPPGVPARGPPASA